MKIAGTLLFMQLFVAVGNAQNYKLPTPGQYADSLKKGLGVFSRLRSPSFQIDRLIDVKQLKQRLPGRDMLPKKFFEGTNYEALYEYRLFGDGDSSGGSFSKITVGGGIKVAKVPVNVSFVRLNANSEFNHSLNNLRTAFSKDAFLSSIESRLRDKLNPKELLKQFDDQIAVLKTGAETSFKKEMQGLEGKFAKMPGGVSEAIRNGKWESDIFALTGKLKNADYLQQIKEKKELIEQLQLKQQAGQVIDTAVVNRLLGEVQEYEGINAIVQKVAEYKTKWEGNRLVKDIKGMKLLEQKKYEEIFKNPASIKKYAEQYLDLSGLEKLMMNVNRLEGGQTPVSLSPLSVSNMLGKGLNLEMSRNNKYLMLFTGRQQDPSSLYDHTANLINNSANNKVNGIRLGVGELKGSYAHMSFFTYSLMTGDESQPGVNNIGISRTNYVATISSRMDFGDGQYLEGELSRSAMQFNNIDSGYGNKQAAASLLKGQGISDNIAAMIRYQGRHEKTGLLYDVKVASVGSGYNNPGNLFLASGQKELSIGLRRSFFKRKLQLITRTQLREYNFNKELQRKWQSLNYSIEGKWAFSKGQSIAIKYQPITTTRREDGLKYIANKTERLSVQGNFSKRLWGTYYRNTLQVSYLSNFYPQPGQGALGNKSVMVNLFQHVALNTNLLYWNVSYQYAMEPTVLFMMNDIVSSDMGITYLFKGVSCSSGLVYSSIKGWYQQAGVRQSVNGNIGKKIEASVFVDARMNIKVYDELYTGDAVQANVSFKYLLK